MTRNGYSKGEIVPRKTDETEEYSVVEHNGNVKDGLEHGPYASYEKAAEALLGL